MTTTDILYDEIVLKEKLDNQVSFAKNELLRLSLKGGVLKEQRSFLNLFGLLYPKKTGENHDESHFFVLKEYGNIYNNNRDFSSDFLDDCTTCSYLIRDIFPVYYSEGQECIDSELAFLKTDKIYILCLLKKIEIIFREIALLQIEHEQNDLLSCDTHDENEIRENAKTIDDWNICLSTLKNFVQKNNIA